MCSAVRTFLLQFGRQDKAIVRHIEFECQLLGEHVNCFVIRQQWRKAETHRRPANYFRQLIRDKMGPARNVLEITGGLETNGC